MVRLLVVVGVRLYREGLIRLLGDRDKLTVVGAEEGARRAVNRLDELSPDVALVDLGIPELDLICAALAARSPRIPLVAIGTSGTDSDVLTCAERGIAGYVPRERSVDELVEAVPGAVRGELICSPRTAALLAHRLAELAAELHRGSSIDLLTRREREIAALMCEHLSNKEIADRLHIEVATVKNHVHNILDKLHLRRRSEIARVFS